MSSARIRNRLRRSRQGLLPPPVRLDTRPDLGEYEIGRFSWGHLTLSNRTPGAVLRIGQFCSLAYGCNIILGGEHRTDFVSTYRFPSYSPFRERLAGTLPETSSTKGDVIIGNDVWIGHNSLILSGVELKDGVVVGAGSVVRQSVPAFAIVAGNPARVAGYRFPKDQIEALLEIKWWDWPIEQVLDSMESLMSDDIAAFIEAADRARN